MLCVASHWKATIHIYSLKKFQKIQKFITFTAACSKSLNSTYGTHGPLGVNQWLPIKLLNTSYEVFAKTLQFRLQYILMEIISPI
jgi:hypothetical protein